MIQQGSIVDVQLTSDTGASTADAVMQQAVSIIASGGQLTSVNPKVLTSLFAGVLNFATSLSTDQPFQVDFPVVCNTAFNSAQDVASIVANSFYQVTGNYPSAVTAVGVTAPNSQGTTPALSTSGVAGNDTGGAGIGNTVSSWISQLGSLGTNLLIGLAAIIVLTLVLIAYGPNIGKVARAVA